MIFWWHVLINIRLSFERGILNTEWSAVGRQALPKNRLIIKVFVLFQFPLHNRISVNTLRREIEKRELELSVKMIC